MGDVGRDDEDLACAHSVSFAGDLKSKCAFEDKGELFVRVGVLGDDAALEEDDAGEHALFAGDELAGEQRVELLGGERVPALERGPGRDVG